MSDRIRLITGVVLAAALLIAESAQANNLGEFEQFKNKGNQVFYLGEYSQAETAYLPLCQYV